MSAVIDAVELVGGDSAARAARATSSADALRAIEVADDAPRDRQRMRVVLGEDGRRRRRSRVCTSAPPSSSAVTTSPVAAFTSGGPPRKIVPCSLTMIDSSDIAGT